jgi:beta-ureidopropionase / N-carbamoyl-L-amino-acid hydrolase
MTAVLEKTNIDTLRVNGNRLWDSLMELAKIGAHPRAACAD